MLLSVDEGGLFAITAESYKANEITDREMKILRNTDKHTRIKAERKVVLLILKKKVQSKKWRRRKSAHLYLGKLPGIPVRWPVFNSGSDLQQTRLHLCFATSCTVARFKAWAKDQRAMVQKLSLKSLSWNTALIWGRLSATFEPCRDKEARGMVIDV